MPARVPLNCLLPPPPPPPSPHPGRQVPGGGSSEPQTACTRDPLRHPLTGNRQRCNSVLLRLERHSARDAVQVQDVSCSIAATIATQYRYKHARSGPKATRERILRGSDI